MTVRPFIDDTVRDIRYALRTFKRAPLVAFIVCTVALGLGLVAVAFSMLNALLFRVDKVPNVHEMFAVERTYAADDFALTDTLSGTRGYRSRPSSRTMSASVSATAA